MSEQFKKQPSEDDLPQTGAQIIAFLKQKKAPVPLEDIAAHIQRDRAITEHYCDRLAESRIIYYVPMGRGVFGYFVD